MSIPDPDADLNRQNRDAALAAGDAEYIFSTPGGFLVMPVEAMPATLEEAFTLAVQPTTLDAAQEAARPKEKTNG